MELVLKNIKESLDKRVSLAQQGTGLLSDTWFQKLLEDRHQGRVYKGL